MHAVRQQSQSMPWQGGELMYRDQIEKTKYLRDRIASSMVASSIFPDRIAIDKRLAAIDTKLALYQYTPFLEADKLNTKKFNEDFMAIYQDLLILYKLVYHFTQEKYKETQSYIDTHLCELEAYADRYSRKAEFESNNFSLGDTIFFQGSGFAPNSENYMSVLKLGKVSVNKGSKISFYIDGNGFDINDVQFKLGDLACSAYKVNGDYIKVPGDANYSIYGCQLAEDAVRTGAFPMEMTSFKAISNYRYNIYGGKNKICHAINKVSSTFIGKEKNVPLNIGSSKGKISFYIIDGSYINFEFSKEPLSRNFTGTSKQGLSKHQYITFEYEGDDFTFDFITDGIIYATCRKGVVKDDILYYPVADEGISDFRIEEYSGKDEIEYDLSVIIPQRYGWEPMITMVAAKELNTLDEVLDT